MLDAAAKTHILRCCKVYELYLWGASQHPPAAPAAWVSLVPCSMPWPSPATSARHGRLGNPTQPHTGYLFVKPTPGGHSQDAEDKVSAKFAAEELIGIVHSYLT